jgi:plastocyanin
MTAAALLVAATACESTPSPRITVTIKGNPLGNPDSFYRPATVHVRVGETVIWIDRDDSEHTVTPVVNFPGAWSGGSSILHTGQTYSFRFTKPGIYRYTCMVHPNMFGVVIVTAAK